MVPVFAGMWSRRLGGTGAVTGALAGIAVGALFFPTRTLSGWWEWDGLTNVWHVLASGNLLASFLLAVVVSSAVTALFVLAAKQRAAREFDLESLADRIRPLESEA